MTGRSAPSDAQTLLIVGTGLVGTSMGLALRGRYRVLLADRDPRRLSRACERGAGQAWDGREPVRLAVAAVPPAAVAGVLSSIQGSALAHTVSHVSSIQSQVEAEVEAAGVDMSRFCGSHPIAGREVSGPDAGDAALFAGRPWVVCPHAGTVPELRDEVVRLAADCGAEPLVMPALRHDRQIALTSHLPQLAASALAAQLLALQEPVTLAGPGLQDTTRIAASDPDLWTDIVTRNAAQLAPLLTALSDDLARAGAALRALDPDGQAAPEGREVVLDLLRRGVAGRAQVPLKRGAPDRDFATVSVRLSDRPGELVTVFSALAGAGVNVEDVRVEHLPGRAIGVVHLGLARSAVPAALAGLSAAGLAATASSADASPVTQSTDRSADK